MNESKLRLIGWLDSLTGRVEANADPMLWLAAGRVLQIDDSNKINNE